MSAAPFTGRLVPRDPQLYDGFADRPAGTFHTCPPPPGQTAAATDAPSSHSCPPHPRPGQDAASGFGHTLPDAAFTITLSPAVALILRLVEAARPDLTRDEIFARAIGIYAAHLGVPALARDNQDLADLPEFERGAPNRFNKEL